LGSCDYNNSFAPNNQIKVTLKIAKNIKIRQTLGVCRILIDVSLLLFSRFGVYRDALSVASHRLEADSAALKGEQRIVTAAPDVYSGMYLRPALPHENVAREHELPVRAFRPETL
jgi:hypothetical protein